MSIIEGLIGPVAKLIDKIIPDPEARDRAELELLKLEISRNDIKARKIRFPNDLGQWSAALVIADRAIQRFVFLEIKFRLETEQRRERCLRIEINRQSAIALHSEVLRHMCSGGRFPGAALKVRNGDDLEMITFPASRGVALFGFGKRPTNLVDLL